MSDATPLVPDSQSGTPVPNIPLHETPAAPFRPASDLRKAKYRRAIYWILAFLLLFQALKLYSNVPADLNAGGNFPAFYFTGVMLKNGERHTLFDAAAQRRTAEQLFPARVKIWRPFLYFYHPPYQAAFLVPFALFSYKAALWLWMIVCLTALLLAAPILEPYLPEFRRLSGVPIALALLAFWPVAESLPEGQDSIFVLLFLAIAFHEYCRGKGFASGVVLGLAMFKFQYTLPVIGILFLRRKPKVALGAFAGGVATLLASWAVVGTSGMIGYWHLLGNHPAETGWRMVNLRGLMDTLHGGYFPAGTLIVSGLVVLWTVLSKARNRREEFSAAVVAAALVSYHMHNYDLVVLLLPVIVLFERAIREKSFADALFPAIFYFAPLEPVIARLNLWYLYSLPMLGLLFVLTRPKVARVAEIARPAPVPAD